MQAMPASYIAVGTKNKCKVAAVQAVAAAVPTLANAACLPFSVESGIADQPLTLAETRQGATNRSRAAFFEAKARQREGEGEGAADGAPAPSIVAVGIESGLFAPDGDTGRMFDVCVCMATEDGETFNMGMSCAFEIPPTVMHYIAAQQMDLSQASNANTSSTG